MANFRKSLAYAAIAATLANSLAPAAHAAGTAGYIGNLFQSLTGSASDSNGEGLTASGQTYQYRLDGANVKDGTLTSKELDSATAYNWMLSNRLTVNDPTNANNRSMTFSGYSGNTWDFLVGHGGGGFFGITENNAATPALGIQATTGYVGVGTGSPATNLHVRGAGANTAAYNSLRLDNPAVASANTTNGLLFYWNTIEAAKVAAILENNTTWDTSLGFYSAAGMAAATEKMRISGAGNVGIGTKTPQALLDLGAGLGVDVTQRFSAQNGAGNSTRGFINVGATTGLMTLTSDQGANGTDRGFSFVTQATERMRIDPTGNVSVGSAGANLTVAANLRSGSGVTNMAANGTPWWMAGTGNGAALMLQQHSGAGGNTNRRGSLGWMDNVGTKTEMLTWDETGNVAIGTTNPRAKLHVYGGNPELRVDYSTSNNYWGSMRWAGLQLGNNGWNRIVAGRTTAGGAMAFYTNNTNDAADYNVSPDGNLAMAMLANGNVGVGQSSAAYRLDVNGDVIANWLRSRGSTGWYNETYGGGMYMTDATWVRAYGGKSLWTSGTMMADTSVQTPIVYDENNNSYYVDPSASSVVNNLTVSGSLAISSALSAPGFTATTSMSAPIYYDSDNAAYYLNPASTSNLNTVNLAALQLGTYGNITDNSVSTYGSIRLGQAKNGYYGVLFGNAVGSPNLMYDGSGNGGMYYEGSYWASYFTKATKHLTIGSATDMGQALGVVGNVAASALYDAENSGYYVDPASTSIMNDVRGNIFYDQGNTAYYVDPASTSNVNNLTVNGTLTATVTRLASSGDYVWNSATLASALPNGITNSFVRSADGFPNYGTLINARSYSSGGGGGVQIYAPYSPTYGGSSLQYRTADYDAGGAWTAFKTIIDSGNIASQTVSNSDMVDGVHAASFLRQDAAGDWQLASSTNGSTSYTKASLELRESNFGGNNTFTAPRLSFHWGGTVASQIGVESSGRIAILNNPGTGYENLVGNNSYFSQMYDADNASYYLDPASSSTVNNLTTAGTLYANGWIYSAGRLGIYNSTYGEHLYADSAGYWRMSNNNGLIFNSTTAYDSAISGYVYHDGSGFGLLASDGNWRLRTYVGGQQLYGTTIADDLRANIFYDQGNTGYYVDPAGTSNVNNLTINGTLTYNGNLDIYNTSPTVYFRDSNERSAMLHNNSNHFYLLRGSGVGSSSWTQTNGAWPMDFDLETNNVTFGANVYAVNTMNATQFVDRDNAGYYVDPNGTSRLAAANLDGPVTIGAASNATGRKLEVAGGIDSNDRIAIGQMADNSNSIQTYIDGHWADRVTYAGGCCNVLSLQPDVGSVGIGTNNPSQKLEVNGNIQAGAIYASNWFRTTGASGWYNETYGGGMYMTDTTWVSAYNGKSLYTAATMRADGAMQSPIYYDLNDNGYYVDPASTSRVNNLRFNGVDSINGFYPANGVIRMTPNLHLNSGNTNAVILNWDNGALAGTNLQLRVGNGASADAFYVRADGNVWAAGGVKTTCVGNCF